MATQILSRQEYPELYRAIAKAFGPFPMPQTEHITEAEARNYLLLCKEAYVKALKEQFAPLLLTQYRTEIHYWSEFITKNWPEGGNPKTENATPT